MAEQAYQFPDEKPPEKNPEEAEALDIKIIDDTPPEDRNRDPLPQSMVEDLDKDDLEEYSEKVKGKMKQLKKVFHDERREKERLSRSEAEALRFAEAQLRENQFLK